MKLVVPYQMPFLAREVGGGLLAGVYAATDFWWTLEDKYPLAKMFVEAFEKKYGYKPEWGAENAYMSVRACGPMRRRTPARFYPPDVIKSYENGRKHSVARRRGATIARKTTSSSARSSSSGARRRRT